MSPSPFGRHQAIAAELFRALANQLALSKCPASILYEIDWIVRDDTVVRPDLVVVCGDVPERHVESVPAIVVEVLSDATRSRDTTYKRELYRQQQVGYFVIVDPDTESITVDVLDSASDYVSVQVTESIELTVCGNCQLLLQRTDVFRMSGSVKVCLF